MSTTNTLTRDMLQRGYLLARLSLADANQGLPFAPSKAQAMSDINAWRRLLVKAISDRRTTHY